MTTGKLSRRLERLEALHGLDGDFHTITYSVIDCATGKETHSIQMPWGPLYRGRRTRRWSRAEHVAQAGPSRDQGAKK